MALARLFDFVAGTLIQDGQVDSEFNQLVNALNGVSDVDILHKFTHASNPVLNVNQLGAGLIQRWQQNTVDKARIINDGYFETVVPAGTLTGKVCQYTNSTVGTALSNSAAETSLFTGVTPSAGSSLTINANTLKVGSVLNFDFNGAYAATAAPNITIRIKIGGSTTLLTLGPNAAPNTAGGKWRIRCEAVVFAIGVSGQIRCEFGLIEVYTFTAGITTAPTYILGGGTPTLNTTVDNAVDLTWQFGAASASNTAQLVKARIDRSR